MKESELFLNKVVAIPTLKKVLNVLSSKCSSLEGIGAKSGRIKPFEFLRSADAKKFFSETPGAMAAAAECVCDCMNCELTKFSRFETVQASAAPLPAALRVRIVDSAPPLFLTFNVALGSATC